MGMRGPKKHLKRLEAPKSWLLKKSEGLYAPRPTPGAHKKEECMPLNLILTKKLGIAQSTKEVQYILKNRLIKINGVIRVDPKFSVGLFDVLTIGETDKHYRLVLNTCSRFELIETSNVEKDFRIAKVTDKCLRKGGIPHVYTSQGTTHRFCDPEIQLNDTVKLNQKNEIVDFVHFTEGTLAYLFLGKNAGCIGTIINIEKRLNAPSLIKMKDENNRIFSTTENFCMVLGGSESLLNLEGISGLKLSELEQSNLRYKEVMAAE